MVVFNVTVRDTPAADDDASFPPLARIMTRAEWETYLARLTPCKPFALAGSVDAVGLFWHFVDAWWDICTGMSPRTTAESIISTDIVQHMGCMPVQLFQDDHVVFYRLLATTLAPPLTQLITLYVRAMGCRTDSIEAFGWISPDSVEEFCIFLESRMETSPCFVRDRVTGGAKAVRNGLHEMRRSQFGKLWDVVRARTGRDLVVALTRLPKIGKYRAHVMFSLLGCVLAHPLVSLRGVWTDAHIVGDGAAAALRQMNRSIDSLVSDPQNTLGLRADDVEHCLCYFKRLQAKVAHDKSTLILVIGYPGAGKTTLVRGVIDRMGGFEHRVEDGGAWIENRTCVVFGRWTGFHRDTKIAGRLDGTDRIHESCVDSCLSALALMPARGITTVIAEGTRLLTPKFVAAAEEHCFHVRVIELETSKEESRERLLNREGDGFEAHFRRWAEGFEKRRKCVKERSVTRCSITKATDLILSMANATCTHAPDPSKLPLPPSEWHCLKSPQRRHSSGTS